MTVIYVHVFRFLFIYLFFQGVHDNCHSSSSCQQPGYVSNKTHITNPSAVAAYEKSLKSTLIFRDADSFCRVCASVFSTLIMIYCPCSVEIRFGLSLSTTSSSHIFPNVCTLELLPFVCECYWLFLIGYVKAIPPGTCIIII